MSAHSFMQLFILVQSFKASLHPLLQSPPGQPSLNLHGFGCCFSSQLLSSVRVSLAGWIEAMGGSGVLDAFLVPVAPAGLPLLQRAGRGGSRKIA